MAYRAAPQDFASYAGLIPCQSACPVGTDARGYVRAIAEGDFERAYLIARGPNPLASVCGRVCGAPCEAACRRGTYDAPIAIRALKRTATERFGAESARFGPRELLERVLARAEDGDDRAAHACEGAEELRSLAARLGALIPGAARDGGGRVAVVGSGPAGLAAAHDLALLGHRPVVFEMEPEPAGMLLYGIPEYRLPRALIRAEVDVIRALGVEFRCGVRIGADVAFDALVRDHDAVVIAIGAKSSRALRLPGAEGPGVMGGVEFLRGISLGELPVGLGRRVVAPSPAERSNPRAVIRTPSRSGSTKLASIVCPIAINTVSQATVVWSDSSKTGANRPSASKTRSQRWKRTPVTRPSPSRSTATGPSEFKRRTPSSSPSRISTSSAGISSRLSSEASVTSTTPAWRSAERETSLPS